MSQAAEQLGYTVGAISQQMASLQKEAGTSLFIKDGRTLALSDAGRLLHRHARSLLASEALASSALDELDNSIDALVRLGVFSSAAMACAAPAIELLMRSDPHISIQLHELDPADIVPAVVAGRVDLALGLEYPGLPLSASASVSKRTILAEPFRVAFPASGFRNVPGRPVTATLPRPDATPADIAAIGREVGWLLPPVGTAFGRAARMALGAVGIESEGSHAISDTALALELTAAGIGLTVATDTMLDYHAGAVASVALPGDGVRKIVTVARTALLSRPSVARTDEALGQVFADRRAGAARGSSG